jgi:hypothetical protein
MSLPPSPETELRLAAPRSRRTHLSSSDRWDRWAESEDGVEEPDVS